MPFRYESPTIRQAATALGVIGFACVGSMTVLAYQTRPIPDALASIGGGAVGALATLLTTFTPSPLPGGRRAADATTVMDPAAAAVEPIGPSPPAARQFGTGGS
jgi:hypothetical protein